MFVFAFDTHWVTVLAFVRRRVRDGAEAEDLAAEVFRIAWEKFESAVPLTRAWLFGIATNVIRTHHRGQGRRARAEVALTRLLEEPPEGVSREALMDLEAGMRKLGSREREMLMLTYWDGLSAEEIAEVIGSTPGAVWTALTRARSKLRGLLAEPARHQTAAGRAR